jgi:CRP/FNR family cyclic AMP-dependent transcriptional regulator
MRFDVRNDSTTMASLLVDLGVNKRPVTCKPGGAVFLQGDLSNSVFCILSGAVKLSVLSSKGKEAVVAVLGSGDFFGEGSLIGQARRVNTATSLMRTSLWRIPKTEMLRVLGEHPDFHQRFLAYMLARNIRIEEDLVNQLFNSTEKRLARALLWLSRYTDSEHSEGKIAKVPQRTLAELVGTTRPRVNHFLNQFRRRGLIDYNGGLKVHKEKLAALLSE